jgi:hypothetical protein
MAEKLRNGMLESGDRARDGLPVSAQCGNGRTAYCSPGMNDKYARGALSIIIEFEREPRLYFRKRRDGDAACGWRERIGVDCFMQSPIRRENLEPRVIGGAQNRRNLDVLIRVVQLVELVQVHAASANKGFCGGDGVFHPLTGCFYSMAGGFEVNPCVACGELEVAILRAVINSNQFPHGMVKGASKIVDSVAYYRGEVARKFFGETDADGQESGCRVGLDVEAVWFRGDEGVELPFKISNVVIGPLDFLFSAVEHDAR